MLRGKWFITYADLRASVIRFLDHNVPVSVVKTSSSSTANFAQNWTENTLKDEKKIRVTAALHSRNCVPLSSSLKMGKGKDKGKGKDNGVCWNCGEIDHYSRDCPSEKR